MAWLASQSLFASFISLELPSEMYWRDSKACTRLVKSFQEQQSTALHLRAWSGWRDEPKAILWNSRRTNANLWTPARVWARDSWAGGGQALQEVLEPWAAVSCVGSSNTRAAGSHSPFIERWDDYPCLLCIHETWGYSTWFWAPLNPNCGQTRVTSLRGPQAGQGWRSCPVRRGWGTGLACRHGAGGLRAAPSTWGRWLRRRGQASLSNETRALILCYAAHSTFFNFFF